MARRIVALALWVYFGWFLTATIAAMLGMPTAIGPIGGIAVGVIALVDWRSRLRDAGVGARQAVSERAEPRRTG